MTTEVRQLVLASRSERRAQLLREAGYRFEQVWPPFEDPPQPAGSRAPWELAAELAGRKALSLRDHGGPSNGAGTRVILAADTVCVSVDGSLLGQPADRDEARRMIESFVNSAHEFITSVALLARDCEEPIYFSDAATVQMGLLNGAQLDAYLDTDQWRGKAGGYNLVERQRDGWAFQISGDPTTVVGLPMQMLGSTLGGLGIRPQCRERR